MVEEQVLEKHIARKMEQGAPEKEVLKQLTNVGWPEEMVQQYITKFSTDKVQVSCLKIESITKTFNSNTILDRIELTIPAGEILAIIGESGSGKSTLLLTLVGFLEPDAGDVILTLQDQAPISIIKHPEAIKKITGFSTQTPSFYNKLTVKENLQYFAALYGLTGLEATEQCDKIMQYTGLKTASEIPAQLLSKDLQKKLDIACSIIHNPTILILDEPTADIDPIATKEILLLIKKINEQGTTIIIASHIIEDAEQICDKVAVLRNKKIMETGTPEELKNIYSQESQITLETTKQNYTKLSNILKQHKVKATTKNNQLQITAQNPEQLITQIPQLVHKCGDKIKSINLNKPTLRDAFETLIKKSK